MFLFPDNGSLDETGSVYSIHVVTHGVHRRKKSVLVTHNPTKRVLLLKWKTWNEQQRKGKELDPRWFDAQEAKAFSAADAKEWRSFLETGAAEVIPPEQACSVPKD